MVLTCVMLMLPALILTVDITVPVTLAMREMGSIVQVSFMYMYHDSTYNYYIRIFASYMYMCLILYYT